MNKYDFLLGRQIPQRAGCPSSWITELGQKTKAFPIHGFPVLEDLFSFMLLSGEHFLHWKKGLRS